MDILRRIKSIVQHGLSQIYQTKDKNFLGFNKYQKYGAYHWVELQRNEFYRRKVDAVASFVHDAYTCLDIGCGDGAYVYALSPKCQRIIGIDADYDAIHLANAKLKEKAVTNCRCMQIPISQLTLRTLHVKRPFDLVYTMDVIEHLPDPHELLQAAGRVVQPQGLVLIGTPLFVSAALVSRYHVQEFTVQEMRAMLSCYFAMKDEIVLPMLQTDGKVYDDGFYIFVGMPMPKGRSLVWGERPPT